VGSAIQRFHTYRFKLWGGCQASFIRYTRQGEGSDKNRLLFANPADSLYRFDITVRISYDEGKTWPVAKIIKKGDRGIFIFDNLA